MFAAIIFCIIFYFVWSYFLGWLSDWVNRPDPPPCNCKKPD